AMDAIIHKSHDKTRHLATLCRKTLHGCRYELATRVPLIISVPGQARTGTKTDALVELVDVYPTLVDVCGLKTPASLEGESLEPILNDPTQPGKQAVFSQYPRARKANRHHGHGQIMGYAVRTDRFRYVEWREWKTDKIVARELYDHDKDPMETRNVVEAPDFSKDISRLSKLLEQSTRRHSMGPDIPTNTLP
ncbi:MAG: DUF4976 domain-containing protein, partial [Pirellulales bacterium]|nr:DUF4976 domain-containing protein [Pirellulales bacterium]